MTPQAPSLEEAIEYNPDTGEFRWKARGKNQALIGKLCGTLNDKGYVIVSYMGGRHKGHRLAWYLMTGEWPTQPIDHINRNRSDNRWDNLRLTTPIENAQNSDYVRGNVAKRGVRYRERDGSYEARIIIDGQRYQLGSFSTEEEASKAYEDARAQAHLAYTKTV